MEVFFFWESCLFNELKILLIIEKSDLDVGLKVRIVYFIFGEKILYEIMSKENVELFDIVKEYLSCLLLDCFLLGYKCFVEFMIDMLIWWKKNDKNFFKLWMFSLLIEEIIGDLNMYGRVVEILKFGFEKF